VRRILVLNHFAAPPSAAGGTRHVELFSRLDGYQTTILASNRSMLSGHRVGNYGDIYRTIWTTPVTRRSASRIVNWVSYAVTSFVRGLRLGPVDIVYGSSPHLLSPLSGWAISKVRRAVFVLEVRDLWPQILHEMGGMAKTSPIYRLLEHLERFLYSRAAAIVVMSEGVREELAGRGYGDKVVYIPNGADPADMAPPAPRAELRARFGFTTLTGVYAGAHGQANGLNLLIEAVASSGLRPNEMQIVLVGSGTEKERLQDLAAMTLREGSVRFIDPIPKTEIPALLGAADFGLHVLADVELFRYGVSPNKLFDYMAAGLPSITNTGGDVGQLVESTGAGISVKPDGLADGLRQMLSADPDQRQKWGDNGRAYMAAHQSRTAMAKRLNDLLERVGDRLHD
jgi:glycosyltransferase involved in cell wall biosynthesis